MSDMSAERGAPVGEKSAPLDTLVGALEWALGVVEMYDERLIELGDSRELVLSDVHLDALRRARFVLREEQAIDRHPPTNTPLQGYPSVFDAGYTGPG